MLSIMNKLSYTPTLAFYRRLLKTMMKVFENDYEMFHRLRIEASKLNRKRNLEQQRVKG